MSEKTRMAASDDSSRNEQARVGPTDEPSGGPTREQIVRHLRRSNEVGRRAVSLGRHPFGALLVGPDHETVLLEQCNIDSVNHAESTLARVAATNFTPELLWGCTLYTAV